MILMTLSNIYAARLVLYLAELYRDCAVIIT